MSQVSREDVKVQQCHEPITMVLLGINSDNKCAIQKDVDDRRINIITTPDDYHCLIPAPEDFITEGLKPSYPGRRLFLLVLQDNKISDDETEMVKKLKERFGEKIMKNTIVVMVEGEEPREETDENLKNVLEECGNRVCKKKQDTKDTEMIEELMKTWEAMQIHESSKSASRAEHIYETVLTVGQMNETDESKGMKTWDTMQKQIHESSNSASCAEHPYETPDELELKNQTHESKGEDVCSPAGVYATVVLVGKNNSDKCLIGNTLLNITEFHPENDTYDIKTGEVQGQSVVIIKTPHPLHLDSKADSMEEMKPSYQGLRVFLLVLEENEVLCKKEMIELQGRFGKEVGENTIVLVNNEKSSFNSLDTPGVTFKTFLDECGNRICCYDRDIKHNDLVKDLMKYIEEIIQKNQPLRSGNEKIVENDVTAVQSYRLNESTSFPMTKGSTPNVAAPMLETDPYTTIVLLGQTGSGKSTTGNTILGRQCFESRASSIPVTTVCRKEEDTVHRTKIRVIDTPDFFNEDLKNQAYELKVCKELIKHGTVVYLLVMELGRFTDGEREVLPRLKKEFGEDVTTKTVILFTCQEKLKDKSLNDYIKETDQGLQELIQSCQSRCCAFNNNNKKSNNHQVKELLEIISQMQTEKNIPVMQHHHQHKERKLHKKECRIL